MIDVVGFLLLLVYNPNRPRARECFRAWLSLSLTVTCTCKPYPKSGRAGSWARNRNVCIDNEGFVNSFRILSHLRARPRADARRANATLGARRSGRVKRMVKRLPIFCVHPVPVSCVFIHLDLLYSISFSHIVNTILRAGCLLKYPISHDDLCAVC